MSICWNIKRIPIATARRLRCRCRIWGIAWTGCASRFTKAVAETSEELMEKYFSGEDYTPDELIMGLATGVRRGDIAPVYCGSAAGA